MTIAEILQVENISDKITKLKAGRVDALPNYKEYLEEYDQSTHKIVVDKQYRPDKTVVKDDFTNLDAAGNPRPITTTEKVARIAISLQKIIVRRAVSFLFGNPVKTYSTSKEENDTLLSIIQKILADNKIDGVNAKLARALFATTEVAEYWYAVEGKEENSKYGIKTKHKIRVSVFSPANGDKLYPYFDEYGDLVAFSREFKKKDEAGKEITYFETWTDNEYMRWQQQASEWSEVEGAAAKFELGKIPIVYGKQAATEWADVQVLIDRLELLLSRFADTNDYHGSPKIVVKGTVKGFAKRGEAGGILEVSGENGGAEYLSWDNAPESVKLEIETLLNLIYTLTQTPDISFNGVKTLGSGLSGKALKLLFLDAHLKVQEKLGDVFYEYLQRRNNILKAFAAKLDTSLATKAETDEIISQVTPFMIDDEQDTVTLLTDAVQGGILSTETAVSLNPLVKDSKRELQKLEGTRNAGIDDDLGSE